MDFVVWTQLTQRQIEPVTLAPIHQKSEVQRGGLGQQAGDPQNQGVNPDLPDASASIRVGGDRNKERPFLHVKPAFKTQDCPWYDRGFCKHGRLSP
ncbi:hypothetical protein MJT46_015358 [Ovis ammon polii x Ovis aries]|nr:hypothetical protein MJT46_015358 [Ovis ammon polii x Ovis aries]